MMYLSINEFERQIDAQNLKITIKSRVKIEGLRSHFTGGKYYG